MGKTGNSQLDAKFSYEPAITLIYGEPAAGKTTLCLLAAREEKGKVIFIDTENSFSAERMGQISGNIPENIIVIKAKNFERQCEAVDSLLELKKQAKLIIIDSHTAHYRQELQEKHDVNGRMSRMLSILSEMAREGIPVILTSQVYATDNGKVEPVGSSMLKNWCPCIMRLEKGQADRSIVLEKHKNKGLRLKFEIANEGIELVP